MHKRLINELTLRLTIAPDGPLLIKAGDRGGMDPTRPDMECVRTWYNGQETVYLPGSSLKGLLRAYCEKIARTVVNPIREAEQIRAYCEKIAHTVADPTKEAKMATRLTCNPLKADANAEDGGCGEKFNALAKGSRNAEGEKLTSEAVYKRSCFVCQLFGHTALASHLQLTDAYPTDQAFAATNKTEQRHGVAIDRVYGSVAVGPFQFETITQGLFETTLILRNFTTPQLGLLGLALRDLRQQRLQLGFAKSRGLGRVKVEIQEAIFRYPVGDLLEGLADGEIAGVGTVLHAIDAKAAGNYGYKADDKLLVKDLTLSADGWGGRQVTYDYNAAAAGKALDEIWKAGVGAWKAVVEHGR